MNLANPATDTNIWPQNSEIQNEMQRAALYYLESGLSVIPVHSFNHSTKPKAPTIKWEPYQNEKISLKEVRNLFGNGESIAIINGSISNNRETLDFDEPALIATYLELLQEIAPGLIDKVQQTQTPSGGLHLSYHCESSVDGNKKLAMNGHKTLIETRGSGGYVLAPPSPGYTLVTGGAPQQTLKIDEVKILHSLARSFSQKPPEILFTDSEYKTKKPKSERPGDIFNKEHSENIPNALLYYGWTRTGRITSGGEHWTRPGKDRGTSATLKNGGLYVFSSNAGLPLGWHDAFSLYTHFGFNGDYKAAATSLKSTEKPKVTDKCLEVTRGCDVKLQPINWLWNGWLAAGKLHILAGAAGTGKTTIALTLAATLTLGEKWPDGTQAPCGEVLIWSGEDDPSDTLAPRMAAAGANSKHVHFVDGVRTGQTLHTFDPAADMAILTGYLKNHPAIKLLIVDPVVSAVSGDSHKNTEVRRGLQPLVDLGTATGCAIVGISHFSKGTSGRDPLERVTGSIAFGAVARIVWATAKMADDLEGRRLLARSKSNIGPDGGGFHYKLSTFELLNFPGVITSKIEWVEVVEGSARELLGAAEEVEQGDEKGALAEAKEFLLDILDKGSVKAKTIISTAKENGIAEKTLRRANKSLGIKTDKSGMQGGWNWSLPANMARNYEDDQQKTMGIFGKNWPSSEYDASTRDRLQ